MIFLVTLVCLQYILQNHMKKEKNPHRQQTINKKGDASFQMAL
jgi:hypothetical protein